MRSRKKVIEKGPSLLSHNSGRKPSDVGTMLREIFRDNALVYPNEARRLVNNLRMRQGRSTLSYQYIRVLFNQAEKLGLIEFAKEEKVGTTRGARTFWNPGQLYPRRLYRISKGRAQSPEWARLPKYLYRSAGAKTVRKPRTPRRSLTARAR